VHDLRTGRTQRIAEGPATGVALSGDGRHVVLATTAALTEDDDNRLDDIYLYDRRTHRTERISHGHPDAPPRSRLNYSPTISANGRVVAYTTATPDAAPGDTNGRECQGRGSAASSVVCYVLAITAVDALKNGLLFERFRSVEKAGPPDIDIDIDFDFEASRRE